MEHIIEIKNAKVYRQETLVFNQLNLKIPQRCNSVILGPNGAGKTTFLMLLTRDLYPVSGQDSYIRIFGKERWNVWDLKSRLGIISQDLQLQHPGSATGLNIILSGLYSSISTWSNQKFHSQDINQAERIMHELDIEHLRHRPYANMSTGEQRLFLLGRALIHDPCTLVLDEPTSGLDLKACFKYLSIVRSLINRGKSIILVTHHIHEIPPEINHIVLFKAGGVLADGTKKEILNNRWMSELYETPVKLLKANGYYQAVPGQVS